MRKTPEERIPLVIPEVMAPRFRSALDVEYIFQQHNTWCWAACIAMAGRYFAAISEVRLDSTAWGLHRVVQDRLDCQGCNEATPDESCLSTVQLENIESKWLESSLDVSEIAVEEEALLEAIDSHKRPVQVFYNEYHAVLVVGTFQDDDERRGFLVHDPYEREELAPREIGALEQQGTASGEGLEILGFRA